MGHSLSLFVIDSLKQSGYTPASASGCEFSTKLFEI
jgi:hypothetical protein